MDFNKTKNIKKCVVCTTLYINHRIVYAVAAIKFNADPATYHQFVPD
jgi:hypothetical protein